MKSGELPTDGDEELSGPSADAANSWLELFLRKEDLNPDLVPFLRPFTLGQSLTHPLVYEVPFFSAAVSNMRYAQKKKDLAEAIAKSDWNSVVFLHERPWRLHAFMTFIAEADGLKNATYWLLLARIWTDSENIWQNHQEWQDALGSVRRGRLAMMSKGERAAYNALPDTLTVFRGAQLDINEAGLSWTLTRSVAEWFAQRFSSDESNPVVLTGSVNKRDVIALLTNRNEDEVVVCDPDCVDYYEDCQ